MRKLVAVSAFVAVMVMAAPAYAHVTVSPDQAVAGGLTRVAFRVPNESDTESTTKVEVYLPENAPVASVSTMPVPGWTVVVTKRKLDKPIDLQGSQVSEVVSVITWNAASADAAVKPGQFQEFPVSLGPIPSGAKQMVFKTLQTYSDGAVVRWIDEPKEGAELEHPAPVLNVTAASGAASPSPLASAEKSNGDNGLVSWIALVAGVLALLLAGFTLARSRRSVS